MKSDFLKIFSIILALLMLSSIVMPLPRVQATDPTQVEESSETEQNPASDHLTESSTVLETGAGETLPHEANQESDNNKITESDNVNLNAVPESTSGEPSESDNQLEKANLLSQTDTPDLIKVEAITITAKGQNVVCTQGHDETDLSKVIPNGKEITVKVDLIVNKGVVADQNIQIDLDLDGWILSKNMDQDVPLVSYARDAEVPINGKINGKELELGTLKGKFITFNKEFVAALNSASSAKMTLTFNSIPRYVYFEKEKPLLVGVDVLIKLDGKIARTVAGTEARFPYTKQASLKPTGDPHVNVALYILDPKGKDPYPVVVRPAVFTLKNPGDVVLYSITLPEGMTWDTDEKNRLHQTIKTGSYSDGLVKVEVHNPSKTIKEDYLYPYGISQGESIQTEVLSIDRATRTLTIRTRALDNFVPGSIPSIPEFYAMIKGEY